MAEAQLDHVIVYRPQRLINVSRKPTDDHVDGKTENRLVLFSDGTYLELIAFIDDSPEKRHGHWWDKPFGVVDFALTTPGELDHDALNERLAQTGTGIAYTAPREGGRLRPDGKEVKWQVTFPTGVDRGSVPFWCHDVTPRERRVPVTAENTRHPCGATGMGGVLLKLADEEEINNLAAAVPALLDLNSRESSGGRYGLGVPHVIPHANLPSIRLVKSTGNKGSGAQLSLVLNSENSVRDICHKIGGGEVSIIFERLKR